MIRLGDRFDNFVTYEDVQDPTENPPAQDGKWHLVITLEEYSNFIVSQEARKAYLKELEEGGNTECVHTGYIGEGVTVYRPHPGENIKTVKVVFNNPRYGSTLMKIRGFNCRHCGYGTPSRPCEVPLQNSENSTQLSPKQPDPRELLNPSQRKLRNLKKKIQDINLLKQRQSTGQKLETNQLKKISEYKNVASEIQELENTIATGSNSSQAPRNGTAVNHLTNLNDDVLLVLASHLPSESLINLGKAYPRLQTLFTDTHVLIQRELRCFFLRTPLNHPTNLLGIGIHFDQERQLLESSFDWISDDAFSVFGVRESADKKRFEFFLPLGFSVQHFEKAYESGKLFQCLDIIEGVALGTKKRPRAPMLAEMKAERSLRVLYKFCNSIIVSLMQATDDIYSDSKTSPRNKKTLLFASEKACIGYLQIYHLLISIMRKDPELRRRALMRLNGFCKEETYRSKSATPDLGELLVMAAVVAGSHDPKQSKNISNRPTSAPAKEVQRKQQNDGWVIVEKRIREGTKIKENMKIQGGDTIGLDSLLEDTVSWRRHLVGPFIEEVFARNARWVLQKHPELAILEEYDSPYEYRLRKTFLESLTSLRLVMFQVFFLETFAADHPERMARQYGFPSPEVPARITRKIKEIYAVNTWKKFLEMIGFEDAARAGPRRLSRRLREAVVKSEERRYHIPTQGRTGSLVALRRSVEPGLMLGDLYKSRRDYWRDG